MRDYKGFTLEPIPGGWNIVLYGKAHTLYVAGPCGLRFTENMKEARAFRDPEFCQTLIDEVIKDHADWVKTLGGKSVINLGNQQQRSTFTEEQIRQQQRQSPS